MAADPYEVDVVIDRALHILTGKAGPDDNLDREARWALQTAQLVLSNEVNPHSFRDTFSVSTTSGTSTYNLPDDFHQIVDGTVKFAASDFRTLKSISIQLYNQLELDANEADGDPTHYMVLNKDKGTGSWRIFFYPTPDSTRTITGTYRSLPEPVWNSNRGSKQPIDRRFREEFIPLLVSGMIACGHFTRYLNATDLAYHTSVWEKALAAHRKNDTPIAGVVETRQTTGISYLRGIPGGVWPAHWGPPATPPV